MNEYELIYLAQEQNEDAREYLYNQYQPIIDIILAKNKYKIKKLNIDPKEIYNIALLALDDAINYYNADLKASFSTYATVIVRNRVNNYLREYRSNKNNYLNNTLSLEDEYIDFILIDFFINYQKDPLTNLKKRENYQELLNKIKNNLSSFEYEVYILYIDGLNYQQIAKILSKNPKQIDNALQRIKNKLKVFINT